MQRYLEERLPFFSIYLPNWFKDKHKKEYENLKNNLKKLTAPFDIHATVRHLTCLEEENKNGSKSSDFSRKSRSISLLREIDEKRSCEDIGISMHYCTCIKPWVRLRLNLKEVTEAVQFGIASINALTEMSRDKCHELELKQIISAEKLKHESMNQSSYRIEFMTMPNKGFYEVLVHSNADFSRGFEFENKIFGIKSRNDISRIDAYDDQPKCVANFAANPANMLDLRKFCFCRKKPFIVP
jgi:hypothetical protein